MSYSCDHATEVELFDSTNPTPNVPPADITIVEVSDVVIGVNMASMTVLAHGSNPVENISIEVLNGQTWQKAEIISVRADESHADQWVITFKLPQILVTSTVDIRVNYCDKEYLRSTINFVSPEFKVEVDAFAAYAIVRIDAAQSAQTELIGELVNIYLNGKQSDQIRRYPDEGYLTVGGLKNNTRYSLIATLYDEAPAQGTPAVEFVTERQSQLPNGSFEDVKDGINCYNLNAGGRYSQNIVDIFNQQNYATYEYWLPEKWANVNAKTFSSSTQNRNTWYMQPSTFIVEDAMEGTYAVVVRSTGWDLHGEPIPDYRQTSTPYLAYNPNIPFIAHRSAGKIFLGDYSFDPSTEKEVYTEGISFSSRPSALNGYYKYMPSLADQSDCGYATIEVIGEIDGAEIVISRANYRLHPAADYTAFSIPLTYSDFGIKATRLKLMMASSVHTGSIEEETINIATYSDPITSTSHGGTLWIDNLTLSY